MSPDTIRECARLLKPLREDKAYEVAFPYACNSEGAKIEARGSVISFSAAEVAVSRTDRPAVFFGGSKITEVTAPLTESRTTLRLLNFKPFSPTDIGSKLPLRISSLERLPSSAGGDFSKNFSKDELSLRNANSPEAAVDCAKEADDDSRASVGVGRDTSRDEVQLLLSFSHSSAAVGTSGRADTGVDTAET